MTNLAATPPTMMFVHGDAQTALYRKHMSCSDEEFANMEVVMKWCTPTPNPHRPSTNCLRKQCAFVREGVKEYDFGQKQDVYRCEEHTTIELLNRVLADLASTYNLFQCNYYENGGVGIGPHQDNEACLDLTYPIVSYSFYANHDDRRPFSFYTLDEKKVLDVPLGHGDMLVTNSHVQRLLKHGMEKQRANKHGPRINITARVATTQSSSS